MSKKPQSITESRVIEALNATRPTSLTALYRAMGGQGSVPGSTGKKIREIVPDIAERLEANKAVGTSKSKRVKAPKSLQPSGKSRSQKKWPRHRLNPFREGSGYATAFDILAGHKDGLHKAKWSELYCKATGKDAAHARYDLAVLLSARDSSKSERHRSCRDGFWIQRENDHVKVRT